MISNQTVCKSCGSQLDEVKVSHNGDEIILLRCRNEGIYAVVGMDGTPVVPASNTPQTDEHITVTVDESGDEVVLAANVDEGFYTTSRSEVEEIVGKVKTL